MNFSIKQLVWKIQIEAIFQLKPVCEDEKSMDPEQEIDWLEKLQSICEGYAAEDISNVNECFTE